MCIGPRSRTEPDHRARERYEAVKVELVRSSPVDRTAYTLGKTDVIASLVETA